MDLQSLPHHDALQAAAEKLEHALTHVIELTVQIQQIAAPTGDEKQRADWVEAQLRALDLEDVWQDDVYNVYARIPGEAASPLLMVSAHTDTVFPRPTDLSFTVEEEGRLGAPGIGDNSAGVAGLLVLAETLRTLPKPPVDIWLVANSNEEGLGDLKGMRAAVDYLQSKEGGIGACIVIEGMGLGRIVHQALGVHRYQISAQAPGGHSWGDFGSASAVHALTQLAAEITRMKAPKDPRTSFNIGKFNGGTSVNTIAQHATLELDLRSVDTAMLNRIDEHVQGIVQRHQENHQRWQSGVTFEVKAIGNRPAGDIVGTHPMVLALSQILAHIGVEERPDVRISSTDANIPLSRGIPSVCIGLTEGADAHRLSEWIYTQPMPKGIQQLLHFTWWTAAWLTTGATNP
ncbi:MAG: M20/M25/M40 family metallo-hydrolase [Caldilineaceae bacterium]|nr:M20/M25/M40 family metallo-hydrolase [Caldilineaceae bacterium]